MSDNANLDTDTDDFVIPQDQSPGAPLFPKPTVRVEFGAVSDIGKVRATNQDHYLVSRIARTFDVLQTNLPEGELPARIEDFGYAMAVADGMGGMACGERASILAIRTGVKLVFESPRWAVKFDPQEMAQLTDRLKQYFRKVDATLVAETQSEPRLTGMGTTLTVAYSIETHVFIVHVGDSRAYLFHNGVLHQLTHDHTVAQELADVGRIPRQQVKGHSARHMLTNFAGGPPRGIVPEVSTLAVADGDQLLLCTDGLTEMVNDREIAMLLRRKTDPGKTARALVDRALAHGGRDNVTVVLARYSILGQHAASRRRRASR
jgi:protein phosphatase